MLFLTPADDDFIESEEKHAIAEAIALGLREGDGGAHLITFVYSPRGEQFTIDKRVFRARLVKEYWYDLRYGCTTYFHATANKSIQTYALPTSGRGNDWILILEE
jgi:hypothetical protein